MVADCWRVIPLCVTLLRVERQVLTQESYPESEVEVGYPLLILKSHVVAATAENLTKDTCPTELMGDA